MHSQSVIFGVLSQGQVHQYCHTMCHANRLLPIKDCCNKKTKVLCEGNLVLMTYTNLTFELYRLNTLAHSYGPRNRNMRGSQPSTSHDELYSVSRLCYAECALWCQLSINDFGGRLCSQGVNCVLIMWSTFHLSQGGWGMCNMRNAVVFCVSVIL